MLTLLLRLNNLEAFLHPSAAVHDVCSIFISPSPTSNTYIVVVYSDVIVREIPKFPRQYSVSLCLLCMYEKLFESTSETDSSWWYRKIDILVMNISTGRLCGWPSRLSKQAGNVRLVCETQSRNWYTTKEYFDFGITVITRRNHSIAAWRTTVPRMNDRYRPVHSQHTSSKECHSFSLNQQRTYSISAKSPKQRHRVFIALGSNMGDRFDTIERACRHLDVHDSISVRRTSGLWETKAMYVVDQADFLNGVCEVRCSSFGYFE